MTHDCYDPEFATYSSDADGGIFTVERIISDSGYDRYGVVENSAYGREVHFSGSKVEVLAFYVGMVGLGADA